MLNSSWVPDEDSQTLFTEKCWLQGAIVNVAAYGFMVSLCCMSLSLLVRRENRMERLPLLLYLMFAFILCTMQMVSDVIFTQMAFVEYRNYPGGPSAFEYKHIANPVDSLGNVAFVLANWFADALVVWRFKVIYESGRVPTWIFMFFPCLLFVASVALGILTLRQLSAGSLRATNGINFLVPYNSISLALNIILTLAIISRLLFFKYRVVSALGPNAGGQYTSIIAMIVESAAIYSVISLVFIVLFAIGSKVSLVFLQSLSQFQAIATLLIVYRVAQGKGWTEDIATRMLSSSQRSRSENAELGSVMFAWPTTSLRATSSRETDKIACG